MRTKNLKNVWWPNTDEHLADRKIMENHMWPETSREKLRFRRLLTRKQQLATIATLPNLPSNRDLTATNRGDVPVLLFFVAKGSILACYHYLSLLSVNVQKIIQNFNQFQSSFASFLSQSLERSSEKSPKDRLFYVWTATARCKALRMLY